MQDACCFKEAQEAFNRETHEPNSRCYSNRSADSLTEHTVKEPHLIEGAHTH